MDEIENRRGFNAGLRILKALLHGNEPNQHSKIYHDENLMGIRKMFLPKYSTPKDVGKITYSPSISDFPHTNVIAAWYDPSNVKLHEKFIKERRFRKVAETDLELGPKLNTEQMLAVVLACTGQICLIQGPPGTGKTFTLMSILRCLVTMRNRYNRGRFHEDVESIMKDLQKEYIEVEGPENGNLWNDKYYCIKIAKKDNILVIAIANVAVEAVMTNVIEHWPGANILKIGGASSDLKLHEYCIEARCHKIPDWFDLDEEKQKEHKDRFIEDADIIFSTCASCLKADVKICTFSLVIVEAR